MGSERDMSQATDERPPPAYPAYPGSGQTPPPARPPLTKRMRPVHWIAIDCLAAGFLSLFITVNVIPYIAADGARLPFPLVMLFIAMIFVPVALRRRAPVTAFCTLLILGVLVSSVPQYSVPHGVLSAVLAVIFLAAAFVLYTVTVEGRRRTGAAALGLILAVLVFLGSAGTHGRYREGTPGSLVSVALANVIAWMTGYSVRQRRLYVVTLQQQAANSAVAEERLRIARELHDVVAHSMSVIAVQAGYGQYVIDTRPGGAKDALGAIQATSRDALEEMRRMLGALRQQGVTPGSGGGPASIAPALGLAHEEGCQVPGCGSTRPRQASLAPAPGLAFLDRLIERTRGAGPQVTLEVTGPPRPAQAGVDLSAYRIIQEALTNVVRHAGTGASCVVSLWYTDEDLVIRVTDDGGLPVALPSGSAACAGSGHGIIGMRERVHLCGGTFSAGPLPDGGFQVVAALPLPVAGPRTAKATARDPASAATAAPRGARTRAAGSPGAGQPAAAGGSAAADPDAGAAVTSPAGNGGRG